MEPSDSDNGALSALGINALRNLPKIGNVSWGARTLASSDREASEWKYIPVRRLALFVEESLYQASKWVNFKPNDELLWSQTRLSFGAFMTNLFRVGAFQGNKPGGAFYIKCDGTTTSPDDVERGTVNIVVGFAPLKPAEFVLISRWPARLQANGRPIARSLALILIPLLARNHLDWWQLLP